MCRAGLFYIPEGRGIFPGLSVRDNMRMSTRRLGSRQARESGLAAAIDRFPVLGERLNQRAGSLSGGEQQLLAMARAFALEPRIIIADEMSLGLAPMMVDSVLDGLAQAKAAGISVVLIEQFVHRALAFADDCVILARGEVRWSGPASDVGDEVLSTYLGEVDANSDESTMSR
jgi:branched-chain amino acid transport system ATP-binding protein